MSLHNLTIGNDNSTAIVYDPPLCNGTGWLVNPQLSGSPRSCTTGSSEVIPTANLTFIGVAVYYTSPTFDGASVGLILDGAASVNISLSEAGGQASNKATIRVVWNATALENKQHILQLRPANGSKTLNVDAFIVTQLDVNATSTVPTAQATTSIGSSIMGLPTQSSKTTRVTIALGTTFGALSFIIFLGIAFFLRRRSRSLKKRYSWSKYIPPLREPTIHTRTRTVNSHLWQHLTGPLGRVYCVDLCLLAGEIAADPPHPNLNMEASAIAVHHLRCIAHHPGPSSGDGAPYDLSLVGDPAYP